MAGFSESFFTLLLSALSVVLVPESAVWQSSPEWIQTKEGFSLEASAPIAAICPSEKMFVEMPRVIHGVHRLYVDGKRVFSSGDLSFQIAAPFYVAPKLSCKELIGGKTVKWSVTTYSKFFARATHFPRAVNSAELDFYGFVIYLAGASSVLILAVFFLLVFGTKVERSFSGAVVAGSTFVSFYFLMTINSSIGIEFSMLTAHKLADICLWLGVTAIFYPFVIKGLLNLKIFLFQCASAVVALAVIISGENGDVVQLGTTIPFLSIFCCQMNILWSVLNQARKQNIGFDLLAISSFFLFSMNDILGVFGIIETELILPIGILLGLSSFAFSVNQKIQETYNERDELLNNLEEKVREKTAHLQRALSDKEAAQAELVQSAKLASLGTLSAGIAHEINNSINFVSGAVAPLEKLVEKGQFEEKRKRQIGLLIKSIRDGATLTVEIVNSLRNFTGLNQAKYKDIHLKGVVDSVLVILKNKLRDSFVVKNEIPEDLVVYGDTVGLNQIVMNLTTNAIDAMEKGNIVFTGERKGETVVLYVRDDGMGIPEEIKNRIFDPFYTTKEVGSGTGLGLYIVKKEIEKHGGSISVKSESGNGTEFAIELPSTEQSLQEAS